MRATIENSLPPTCEVTIPTAGDNVGAVLGNRWMQHAESSLPAAVVIPSTEEDVVSVVQYAAKNGLKVIPSGGGCAGFLVVDSKSIYLNLHKLNSVDVDEEKETVTVGGGTIWGDVIPVISLLGYYTSEYLRIPITGWNEILTKEAWANFSCVGVVGSLLGGGMSPFVGIDGYACDQVTSVRIVTSSGDIKTLSNTSRGREKNCSTCSVVESVWES